jgi:hypothetical protein
VSEPQLSEQVVAIVREFVEKAVADERLACAKAALAEAKFANGDDAWANACEHVATCIMARGEKLL